MGVLPTILPFCHFAVGRAGRQLPPGEPVPKLVMNGKVASTREGGASETGKANKASGGKGLGHQVTLVVDVSAAAVEFDGRVVVADLEVKELGVMLAGEGLG